MEKALQIAGLSRVPMPCSSWAEGFSLIVSQGKGLVKGEKRGKMKRYEILTKQTLCEGRFLRCLKIT